MWSLLSALHLQGLFPPSPAHLFLPTSLKFLSVSPPSPPSVSFQQLRVQSQPVPHVPPGGPCVPGRKHLGAETPTKSESASLPGARKNFRISSPCPFASSTGSVRGRSGRRAGGTGKKASDGSRVTAASKGLRTGSPALGAGVRGPFSTPSCFEAYVASEKTWETSLRAAKGLRVPNSGARVGAWSLPSAVLLLGPPGSPLLPSQPSARGRGTWVSPGRGWLPRTWQLTVRVNLSLARSRQEHLLETKPDFLQEPEDSSSPPTSTQDETGFWSRDLPPSSFHTHGLCLPQNCASGPASPGEGQIGSRQPCVAGAPWHLPADPGTAPVSPRLILTATPCSGWGN